jgi:hypothetical protein
LGGGVEWNDSEASALIRTVRLPDGRGPVATRFAHRGELVVDYVRLNILAKREVAT